MNLILNGERTAIDASDCANLAELVARSESLVRGAEEAVVTEVAVDGHVLPPEALSELERHALAGVACVEIVRRPRREVALGVLDQGAAYCGRIVAAIGEASGDYRAGRVQRASQQLADVIDALSVLTGITYSIAGVFVEEARSLAALQGEIQPWLEEMLDAQTGEDPILIADLLEYEIAPRVESWGKAMRAIYSDSARSDDGR
ncbi:MAG: hypothetical protein R3F35_00515 [Myxococcota bacterium]